MNSEIDKAKVTITVVVDDDTGEMEPDPVIPDSQDRIGPLLELSGSDDPAAILRSSFEARVRERVAAIQKARCRVDARDILTAIEVERNQ